MTRAISRTINYCWFGGALLGRDELGRVGSWRKLFRATRLCDGTGLALACVSGRIKTN
jgi:hypothetical protein